MVIAMSSYVSPEGINFVRNKLAKLPRPDKFAARAVQNWAKTQGIDLNPDKVDAVVLHFQWTSYTHAQAVVAQKMSLTQALLSNWQGESSNDIIEAAFHHPWAGPDPGKVEIVEKLQPPGVNESATNYGIFNGLYRRSLPQVYGPKTHVKLPAEAFQKFIWELDVHKPYKKMLDTFWSNEFDGYQTCAKINFLAATNKQISEGSLTEAGKELAWQLADVAAHPTWESLGHAPQHGATVQASPLNIYGYAATDILCLKNNVTGLTVLYIPGNSSPLHEFADEATMKTWLAEQCKDPRKRQALMEHFAPGDVADGATFSGLETALKGLASYPHAYVVKIPGGTDVEFWEPQDIVNYRAHKYSPPFTEDVFLALTKQQKTRAYQDADFTITTDSSVTKAKWRGYVSSTINMLAPLALIVPELAPIFVIGGIAQFGLGLDLALNAKTREEKVEGIEEIVFGLLNAAPLFHAQFSEKPAIARSDRFVRPRRINGQIGYPLSPLNPPHLPPNLLGFFDDTPPIRPLAGSDPLVSGAVLRFPSYNGLQDRLQADLGYPRYVYYDLKNNAFFEAKDWGKSDITYYVTTNGKDMETLTEANREATNAQRMSTLRALGIELPLPVDFKNLEIEGKTPIPKKISGLWVGNKEIGESYLEAIKNNAHILRDSDYEYRIFLSNQDPSAYAKNLALLEREAPTVTVLPLEDQDFYKQFSESKYFEQYQAALDGNGGVATNYSSASDILRYPMLHKEGGIYMDLDDTLRTPGEVLRDERGVPYGAPAEAISDVELSTSDSGLLLHPPVNQQDLGMHVQFNSSFIGTHPSNPTLEAISEEIHLRYQKRKDFYNSKPDTSDTVRFKQYAVALNQLTGPGILNDVIAEKLPDLKLLREMYNVEFCSIVHKNTIYDPVRFQAAMKTLTPANRFATIGGEHSWQNT